MGLNCRVLALTGLALVVTPAQARPPEALACALQTAPPGLDARVADVLISTKGVKHGRLTITTTGQELK